MKSFLTALLLLTTVLFWVPAQTKTNLYDFDVKDIDGKEFKMSSLKGKKVMIVNVASKCGYTPQYKELQELYDTYGDSGFVVVAFPSNDFKKQEPGSNAQIKEFCTDNYGITFPMMGKISVTGDEQAPIYAWLTHKSKNSIIDQDVTWNFQKYLIDRNGDLVDVLLPRVSPQDPKIIDWITEK